MSMIINLKNMAFETQSHRTYPENWNGEEWIAVPFELETIVLENAPYCNLEIQDGVLVGITPTEKPSFIKQTEPVPGGFYVGSGSYGQECPTVFQARENAEMLVIQDGGRGETKVVFPAADEVKDSAGDTLCRVAVEGTAVKLWSEESAEKQFNRAGVLYHYYSV